MGDVKLAFVMGLFLGRDVGVGDARRAASPGRSSASPMMARKGTAEGRKTAIPFGPFLAFGGVVGLLAGDADGRLVPAHLRLTAATGAHGVMTPQVALAAVPISEA